MNDADLRRSFPLPSEPATLDAKIDRALARHVTGRRTKRRVFLGTTVTAMLAAGLVVFPAVQAEATLRGIVRSLDERISARVVTYTVDEAGRRWPSATTTIANGDVAIVEARGGRQYFDVGTSSYALDPTIGRFIVSSRRPGGSIRLSDMLGGASGFSLGKRVDLRRLDVDGRAVLRATILNGDLPERYVIDADPKTELPVRMHVDAFERGEWKVRSELEFDYSASATTFAPDLRRFPPITAKEADADFERAITREALAELPLKRGRLVVRALEIAHDGTVFVAYQSGDGQPNRWNGYALDLADDLGTRYVRVADLFSAGRRESTSPEGAVQMEVFAPLRPIAPDRVRTLNLTAHKWSNGRLARRIALNVVHPGGRIERRWQSNAMSRKDVDAREFPLLTRKGSVPTCGAMPSWAARMAPTEFGNDAWSGRIIAQYRAQSAMDDRNWPEAGRQLNEQLRLIREAEARGFGSYSRVQALEDLDKVRSAQRG